MESYHRWQAGPAALKGRLSPATWLWLLVCWAVGAAEPRLIPKPLPEHPGNVFVAGEEVVIALTPSTLQAPETPWQLVDYDGNTVAQGAAAKDGKAVLGKLPVGYYELRRVKSGVPEQDRLTIGVLAPLRAPTPRSSPIGLDVGMAWNNWTKAQQQGAASLCTMAGINWVRDRLSWQELEPEKDRFDQAPKYDDSARVQSQAGLQVLPGLLLFSHLGEPEYEPPTAGFARCLPICPGHRAPLARPSAGLRTVERS